MQEGGKEGADSAGNADAGVLARDMQDRDRDRDREPRLPRGARAGKAENEDRAEGERERKGALATGAFPVALGGHVTASGSQDSEAEERKRKALRAEEPHGEEVQCRPGSEQPCVRGRSALPDTRSPGGVWLRCAGGKRRRTVARADADRDRDCDRGGEQRLT
jgi:hypothetical protein